MARTASVRTRNKVAESPAAVRSSPRSRSSVSESPVVARTTTRPRAAVSESPAATSPEADTPRSTRGAFSSTSKRAVPSVFQDTPSKRQRVKARAVRKVEATPPSGVKASSKSPRLGSVVKKLALGGEDLDHDTAPVTVRPISSFYGNRFPGATLAKSALMQRR